jgi:transcriptional regulator with XRE-family HTH domain
MLEKEQTWVSRRLNGVVAFDLDDLERIARALDVPVAALLPRLDSNQKPAVLRRPERHLRLVQPRVGPAPSVTRW